MLTHLNDVIMAEEDSSLEEPMQEEVDGIVEEMAVDMVDMIHPEEVTMPEPNMAHGGERDNNTLEGLGFETGKMAVKFQDVDMRGKDADGKTCIEFHRTMKDGKEISDDEEVAMTEPSSSRDSDNSDQDGSVVVSKVIEDYLEKEDSSSEFSFESSGTLEDDANTLDGFVDLSPPFNMDLLRSCIEKGSSVLEKVRGKDVVVVVGKTGVGKSLFIQGLAGKKIVKVKHQTEYSGETVLRDVFEAEEPIPGFDVGHKKVSKTKSINCFVRKDAGTSEQSMIYVDSPGFEDTSGPEVDIATSVMLSQVAKEARSLRFVVLINYASLLEDRGGAMRSVLKLAHTFVSDFEADKKSFMFLFTHASRVDSPDSLNSARMRLINDIVCILDGTGNPEVEKVLKFIQKSLQKEYKFVDILHPIFSDFNAIADFAETKLKKVKNPAIVLNCGLTMAAELKLTSQLQYLLLRLRDLLSSENANQDYIQEIKQIQATFRYFKRYIGVDKVQESAGVSESLFEKYLGEQRKIVEEQLSEAGRDCDTATFDDGNVAALRTALYEIAELEDTNSFQYYQKRIDGAFNDSHNKFFCQDGHLSLDEALRELGKLRAWASAFEKFVPAYKKACAVIEENTSATTTNVMRMSSIPSNVTKEELATYVRALGDLQQQEFARHKLSAHEVSTVQQLDAMERLKTLLCSLAIGWVVPTTSSLGNHEDPWSSMPSQLQLATRQVAKLEFLQAELVKMQDFATIVLAKVSRALGEHHSFLTEGVGVLCDDLKSHATQDKFGVLVDIISAVIKLPGQRWKDVEIPYKALLEQLKADLKGRFGAIESSAKQTPLKDGEQAAVLLLALLEFKWFDSFVTPAFVESDCDQLLMIYRVRFEVVMKEGLARSLQLSIASKRNTEVLREVYVSIAEIKQFELFWRSAVGEEILDPRKPNLIACLRTYRENLVIQSKRWSDKWYSHLKSKEFDEARALTETLNAVLEEVALIETLTHLFQVKKAASTAKSYILRKFKLASDYVNAEFDKRANYSKQADCLACIAKIQGFPLADAHLPSFTLYSEKARSIVSKDAIEIEKLLDESADGTQIATCLNNFEAARVLDPYTNDEATNRMRPLEALRVKRAGENEKLLDGMIQRNDFSGMGELIRPLSVSRGLIEKNKFSEYKRRIEKSLKDRVAEVKTRLLLVSSKENEKKIAATIHLLEEASKEIGFMFIWKEFNLSSEANDARKKLTARFRTLVSGMTEGCKSRDCYAMAKNHNLASNIFEQAEPFLNYDVKGSFRESVSEMEKILKDLPKQVDGFCASYFQDSSYLEQLLPSLKVASSSRDPELPRMGRLFTEMQDSLAQKSNDVLRSLRAQVDTSGAYDDGIDILNAFQRSKGLWMDGYVTTLPFDLSDLLDEWKEKRAELEREEESQSCTATRFRLNKSRLNELKPRGIISKGINYFFKSYENLQKKLDKEGHIVGEQANFALRERDWDSLQRSLNVLSLMAKELSEHILEAEGRVRRLRGDILRVFLTLCRMSVSYLKAADSGETDSLVSFQAIFPDLRQCVVCFGFVLDDTDAKKEFCLATQLVHDILKSGVSRLNEAMSCHDFSKMRALVVHNRTTGAFFVDHYMLMKEELQLKGILTNEKWLSQLFELCNLHFSDGRDLANIKSCAILGVLPSATEDEVKHAFRQKAREVHPDKKSPGDNTNGSDSGEEFRRAKEASDILTGPRSREKVNGPRFFASEILKIPADLKNTVRQYLRDQAYNKVELLLERMTGFPMICDLVTPPLDHDDVQSSVIEAAQDCAHGLKVDVQRLWNERKYKELNHAMDDLKQMQSHLKSFPDVFPESWNRSIIEQVQQEIDMLGQKARNYLRDKNTAASSVDDFRRCFIQMGSVLVELQSFKNYTKSIMFYVLESCLKSDWGYSYLFELGLGFHKGDESLGEDENRVAQTLLSEFSHFKEVMTMVWNEETAQKPVEDTVNDIVGEQRGPQQAASSSVDIDRPGLLHSFMRFEAEYKKLLGEYLGEDADKKGLAKRAIALARSLKPLRCDSGWDSQVKDKLPILLATVFALFTILKSGESFNRIQKSADAQSIGEKLLMKPHNIQVLTLLHLLGCGKGSVDCSLESHLMQIRTGEGKSIILGAAAAMLGLLGFKVRCVCYSEYLSCRDYNLFKEVFDHLSLGGLITYSKITTLSEDTTAAKGNIRALTEALLRQKLSGSDVTSTSFRSIAQEREIPSPIGPPLPDEPTDASELATAASPTNEGTVTTAVSNTTRQTNTNSPMEEILLVDEVDVFFGPDFYGKTYNQVMELHEPEIAEILTNIWIKHVQDGRKQKLADIQASIPYQLLVQKMPSFRCLIDNEIRLMLDHVQRVDEEKYYLDASRDLIGYKVLDTISYQATYGYRTVFAYLKEASADNLKDKSSTLQRVLNMPIPCGQFSYASISPSRILGVSGTLEAMGDFEKDVLRTYGVNKYFFVPSVYGGGNFVFDKAGDGISIEPSKSDYFQKIYQEIQSKTQQKRAVIVFFEDGERLDQFKRSPFFPKLGRQKAVLVENMEASEKEFVINKAATAGQATLCPAVFGRGTDFFCKDERVQAGGGVHIIQTFLSSEKSEEVQIQGRTSRQGKKGSYQLVLWEDDLQESFGLTPGAKDSVPIRERYQWLCEAREKRHKRHWDEVADSLKTATARDADTHEYFNALLASDQDRATRLFQDLYSTINKPPIPDTISIDIALLLDTTGSMAPYSKPTVSTIKCLISGNDSILSKLKLQFPDTLVKLRLGILGYRDIDDTSNQFCDSVWTGGGHFTESLRDALSFADQMLSQASGGNDLAEDHLGAIHRSLLWNGAGDWSSQIKLAVLFTDAPAHGCAPAASVGGPNIDSYAVRHPGGLTPSTVAGDLAAKGVNLMICSYNPFATAPMEQKLSQEYANHDLNSEEREIKTISMIPRSEIQTRTGQTLTGDLPRHIVFVLDESGSMDGSWSGVVTALQNYVSQRRQNQNEFDIVSVVQFDSGARVTMLREPINAVASRNLHYSGGGTQFAPAALEGSQLVVSTPTSHKPTLVFMSDGGTNDSAQAASTLTALNNQVRQKHGDDLELHVIAFGGGADTRQLQEIRQSSPKGKIHMSSDTIALSNIFVNIAGGQQVVTVLQEEIGKQISDAVSETLSLGYLS